MCPANIILGTLQSLPCFLGPKLVQITEGNTLLARADRPCDAPLQPRVPTMRFPFRIAVAQPERPTRLMRHDDRLSVGFAIFILTYGKHWEYRQCVQTQPGEEKHP